MLASSAVRLRRRRERHFAVQHRAHRKHELRVPRPRHQRRWQSGLHEHRAGVDAEWPARRPGLDRWSAYLQWIGPQPAASGPILQTTIRPSNCSAAVWKARAPAKPVLLPPTPIPPRAQRLTPTPLPRRERTAIRSAHGTRWAYRRGRRRRFRRTSRQPVPRLGAATSAHSGADAEVRQNPSHDGEVRGAGKDWDYEVGHEGFRFHYHASTRLQRHPACDKML